MHAQATSIDSSLSAQRICQTAVEISFSISAFKLSFATLEASGIKRIIIWAFVGIITIHDYALYRRSHPHLPNNVRMHLDLGYLGIKLDYPKLNCVLPFKKKNPGRGKRGVKAQELSAEQKAFNKQLAKERVVSEHTNSRVKKFQIWGGEFRNRLKHYDIMTDVVCGLLNFRISGTMTI